MHSRFDGFDLEMVSRMKSREWGMFFKQIDLAGKVGDFPRYLAGGVLAVFSLVFGLLGAVVPFAIAGRPQNGNPPSVGEIALITALILMFSLLSGWMAKRLLLNHHTEHGTLLPLWFIQAGGLIILSGTIIGAFQWQGTFLERIRTSVTGVSLGLAMITIPWWVRRRRRMDNIVESERMTSGNGTTAADSRPGG